MEKNILNKNLKVENKKELNNKKESNNLNKEKLIIKNESKYSTKDKLKKEDKENQEILIHKEKIDKIEECNESRMKLLSVCYVDESEKYFEEFIQIKKQFKLDKEKSSLPVITKKPDIDKITQNNQSDKCFNKEYDFEKKFQLRGLVHEKEEFLNNGLMNNTGKVVKNLSFRKNNFDDGIINNENNYNKNFYQNENRNIRRKNSFKGNFRGRNWKSFNN